MNTLLYVTCGVLVLFVVSHDGLTIYTCSSINSQSMAQQKALETKQRLEAEEKARKEAEAARLKREQEEREAKELAEIREAKLKAKAEREAKAKAEAEEKARIEAEAKVGCCCFNYETICNETLPVSDFVVTVVLYYF